LLQARRGAGGEGRVSALLPLLDDVRHRLRRGPALAQKCEFISVRSLSFGESRRWRVARFVHTYRTGHFHSLW